MSSRCFYLFLFAVTGVMLIAFNFSVNPLAAVLSLFHLCTFFSSSLISCLQLSCFFWLFSHIARVHLRQQRNIYGCYCCPKSRFVTWCVTSQ